VSAHAALLADPALPNDWRILVYPLLAVVSLFVTGTLWSRLMRGRPDDRDPRMIQVLLGALIGVAAGAKIAFILGDLPRLIATDTTWLDWVAGKSVTGALLGGYAGIEIAKRITGYRRATGDLFALLVPISTAIGRVGCVAAGCCGGVAMDRAWYTVLSPSGGFMWPSAQLEFGFNLTAAFVMALLWRRGQLRGQLFHVYLIAYGLFRFGHEFVRDTPRMLGPISGYHLLALGIFALGLVRFVQRRRTPVETILPPARPDPAPAA
jgi:phosphatidylglycerol:prolipoprotein diacylglycerol transferase